MKQIAVIGAGNFGFHVATTAAARGAEVLVIDSREEAVQRIKDLVTSAVVADALDKKVLASLEVGKMDTAVVAVGERFDSTVLLTLYLKELGVREIIVKALSDDQEKALLSVGATQVICPERDIARHVAMRLIAPGMADFISLSSDFSIAELTPPDALLGKTLAEAEVRKQYNLIVIAAVEERKAEDGGRQVQLPSPSYVFRKSDHVVVLGHNEDIERFRRGG